MTVCRDKQPARCAFELADLIAASGYKLLALQTTSGPFEGRFSIVQNDDALIVGIECNRGVRFIGQRNMKVTCFSSCIQGTGWWRTQKADFPHLLGYHNAEASSNFLIEPTSDQHTVALGAVLLNRRAVHERAAERYPRALQMLASSNHCTPDLFRHTAFANEVNRRFRGEKAQEDLLEMALVMLETATTGFVIPTASEAELRLIDGLAEYTQRIAAGQLVNAAVMEEELQMGSTTLNKLMTQTVGIKPGQWVTKTQTETVLQLLLDPIKRRSLALGDQVSDLARYVHWQDAKTARRNIEKLTGSLPSALLMA